MLPQTTSEGSLSRQKLWSCVSYLSRIRLGAGKKWGCFWRRKGWCALKWLYIYTGQRRLETIRLQLPAAIRLWEWLVLSLSLTQARKFKFSGGRTVSEITSTVVTWLHNFTSHNKEEALTWQVYIPSRFQKRQICPYIAGQDELGVWKGTLHLKEYQPWYHRKRRHLSLSSKWRF